MSTEIPEILLLEFEDNCRLWLRGKNDEPIAYLEAAIYIKYEDITAWGVQGLYIDRNQYR